jgi:anti-anti-sigma factor
MATLKHYVVSKGNAVIVISGRMDAEGCRAIESELWSAIRAYPRANIAIDINEVDAISSYAVGLLVEACGTVTDNGGKMALAKPQPQVYETLYLNGADVVIPIYESYQQALKENEAPAKKPTEPPAQNPTKNNDTDGATV